MPVVVNSYSYIYITNVSWSFQFFLFSIVYFVFFSCFFLTIFIYIFFVEYI